MPTDTNVRISPRELTLTVESVFGTMLGLEVIEGRVPAPPTDNALVAAVQLTGPWNGAVLVECAAGAARRFAGRFLSMDPPAAVDDLVRDVLGELANMIGGNLKCVLACGTRVSLPSVLDGSEFLPGLQAVQLCARIPFQSAEGPFYVTLLANAS